MQVRATAITQSLVEGLELTPEDLIVYEARVSNPDNQGNLDTAPKLLRFLIDKEHWSPFDMVNFTVEVKTSKAVAIQILRHWSIHPQEYSQRYAEVTEVEPIELRRKAGKNRQGSDGEVFNPKIKYWNYAGHEVIEDASYFINHYITYGKGLYQALLKAEVAPECARMITPIATTTTMYLNGTVRSWIHYLRQRTSEHAQKEHKLVALEIEKLFEKYFPNVLKAIKLKWNQQETH